MAVTRDDSYNGVTIETIRDCSSNQPSTSRSDPDIIQSQAFEPASPHNRDTDGPPVFQIIEPIAAPPISAGHRLLIALLVVTGNLIQVSYPPHYRCEEDA